MKDFDTIQQDVITRFQTILAKNNINPDNFLRTNNENNSIANNEILQTLAGAVDNDQEMEELISSNRSKMDSIMGLNLIGHAYLKNPEYKLRKTLHQYFENLYGTFFRVENGKVILTEKEKFDFPSKGDTPDYDNNKAYLNKKMNYELNEDACSPHFFITKDGTIYHAPTNDHMALAMWLNVNNISIDRAIRIEAEHASGRCNMTTLYNYAFSETSNNDLLIKIGEEQAESLKLIYGTLKKSWYYAKPFNHNLRLSSGFGLGIKELEEESKVSGQEPKIAGIAEWNLLTLEEHMGEFFNKKEFLLELRSGNHDAHSSLQG